MFRDGYDTISSISIQSWCCFDFLTLIDAIFLLYGISLVVYRLTVHELASFPGRKLAAATKWYEFYFDIIRGFGGQYAWEIDRMHEQYGQFLFVRRN